MKYKLTLIVFVCFLYKCHAENTGACEIEEIDWVTNTLRLDPIPDNETFEYRIPYTGRLEVVPPDPETDKGAKYLDILTEDLNLVIRTNENFANIEEDYKDEPPAPTFLLPKGPVTLTCNEGVSTFALNVFVQDTNNHKPTFDNPTYELVVPMPIVPKFDITSIGIPIVATDIDMSNTEVSFSIDSVSDFTLETVDAGTKKYRLVLRVENFTRFEEDTTFTVTATDGGTPSSSGTTQIIIKKDPQYSIADNPSLSETIYEFDYSENSEGTPSVLPRDGKEIEITSSSNLDACEATLSDKTYFKATCNPSTSTVSFTAVQPVGIASESVISLILTVTNNDGNSKAAILVHLPKENSITIPTFSAPYYQASYVIVPGGNDTVNCEDIIVTEEAIVTITGDDRFYVTKTETDTWNLQLNGNLDESVINEGGEIVLTLNAKVTKDSTDYEGSSVIIVKLPEIQILQFSSSHYSATYNINPDGQDQVSLLEGTVIGTTSDQETVEIGFQDTSDNFNIEKIEGVWTVTVKTDIDEATAGDEYILTLQATIPDKTYIPAGLSTLIISVPVPPAAPKFSNPFYTATYQIQPDTDSIQLNGDITVNAEDGQTIDVQFDPNDSNSGNFNIGPNSDATGYEVTLKTNLDDLILIEQTDIILTLSATVTGVEAEGRAALVVQLPKQTAPAAFTNALYEGTYVVNVGDNNDVITMDPIDLTGHFLEQTTVALTAPEGFDGIFTISEIRPYEITVLSDLTEDILKSQQEIVLSLEASLTGSELHTSSSVKITLPPAPPKFKSVLYTATYKVNEDNTATVTFDGDKITIDAEPTAVLLAVEPPYDSNFAVEYIDNEYNLIVQSLLDTDIVDHASEIYVILDVTVESAIGQSSAAIALKMPEKTENVVPTFSEIYYKANYNDDDPDNTVIIGANPIIITSDQSSDTQVEIDDSSEFASNFDMEFDGTSWQVRVVTSLDVATLNEADIAVPLTATLTGSAAVGTATLIISLPNPNFLKGVPRFSEPFYSAEYSFDENGEPQIAAPPIIIASGDEELVNVALESTNFEITRDTDDNKQWNVALLEPLDDNTLKENNELALKITAELANSVGDGATTLIVKLPTIDITFDNTYYSGIYKKDSQARDIVVTDVPIVVTNGASVVISNEFKENFNITCDASTCILTVNTVLGDDVLESKNEIIFGVEATKSDTNYKAKATILLKLPLQDTFAAPKFSKSVYVATYSDDGAGHITITPDEPIHFEDDTHFDDIIVTFTGENSDAFDISRNEDHWEITSTGLPPEDISSKVSILLTLEAVQTDVTVSGFAGFVIQLPKQLIGTFHFEHNLYIGDYDKESGFLLEEDIKIEGDSDGSAEVTLDGEYKDLFEETHEGDIVIITLNEVPDEILNTKAVISVDITATKGEETTTTTLVVTLPKSQTTDAPVFSQIAYSAKYQNVDGDNNDVVTLNNGPIKINGISDASIFPITVTGDQSANFELVPEDDHWNLHLLTDLTTEIIETEVSLFLTLKATIEGVDGESGLIITLPKKVSPTSFSFDSNVYVGEYEVDEEGNPQLTIDNPINIEGDPTSTVEVTLEGDYAGDFNASYENSVVTVTVTDPLDEILNDQPTVTVYIKASKDDETVTAVLVVKLPQQSEPITFYFEENAYLATYAYDNNIPKVTLDKSIVLQGDTDTSATVALEGDYINNFDINYADGEFTLSITNPLDGNVLDSEPAIPLTIKANRSASEAKSALVIKLPKSSSTFFFESTVYEANYTLDGDNAELSVDSDVILNGNPDQNATIVLGGDYKDYFKFDWSDGKVVITVNASLPADVLNTEPAILLTIVASLENVETKTVLVIKLPKQTSTTFYFDKSVYEADYETDGGPHLDFNDDEVTLEGDSDHSATFAIDGDYKDKFTIAYDDDGKVRITVESALSDDILDKSAITLNLAATRGEDTATATVVVKLPKSDNDDKSNNDRTGLIVAVSILAVLLVASLVGSAVFYYFKFKKANKFNDLQDEHHERPTFRKNSNTGDTKLKIEHPTRRATGVIKYALSDEIVGDTTTDLEPSLEKRKSVQFDTENIDELEIEQVKDVEDSDDNAIEADANDLDENEERRSSRV